MLVAGVGIRREFERPAAVSAAGRAKRLAVLQELRDRDTPELTGLFSDFDNRRDAQADKACLVGL